MYFKNNLKIKVLKDLLIDIEKESPKNIVPYIKNKIKEYESRNPIKKFDVGTRFFLKGNYYIVTIDEDFRGWITYEYEDKREPKSIETMGFMPKSKKWHDAEIINN